MIGKLGTHSLRYSYRSWLDALGTPLRCSKNPCGMQASGVRTAFNIYEDAVTNKMAQGRANLVFKLSP